MKSDSPPATVRVRYILTSQPAARALDRLWPRFADASDRARNEALANPDARVSGRIARVLLRLCLSEHHPDVSPEEWRFAEGPHGKPLVAKGLPPALFNVSHTRGLVAVAIGSAGNVGIDTEWEGRRVNVQRVARRRFAESEVTELLHMMEEQRQERFLATWTLKESWLKALGTGLSRSSRDFSFRLPPEIPHLPEMAPVAALLPRDEDSRRWGFFLTRPTREHFLAVAGEGLDAQSTLDAGPFRPDALLRP